MRTTVSTALNRNSRGLSSQGSNVNKNFLRQQASRSSVATKTEFKAQSVKRPDSSANKVSRPFTASIQKNAQQLAGL